MSPTTMSSGTLPKGFVHGADLRGITDEQSHVVACAGKDARSVRSGKTRTARDEHFHGIAPEQSISMDILTRKPLAKRAIDQETTRNR
jgi:hypothetical protein